MSDAVSLAGRDAEAPAAVHNYRPLDPGFSLRYLVETGPYLRTFDLARRRAPTDEWDEAPCRRPHAREQGMLAR
jgi:hypothetical protein